MKSKLSLKEFISYYKEMIKLFGSIFLGKTNISKIGNIMGKYIDIYSNKSKEVSKLEGLVETTNDETQYLVRYNDNCMTQEQINKDHEYKLINKWILINNQLQDAIQDENKDRVLINKLRAHLRYYKNKLKYAIEEPPDI